jgi:hypothetical protein
MSGKQKITTIINFFIIACLGVSALACNKETSDTNAVKTILFVGNSLTYTNDLPALVVQIGKGKGVVIKKEMLAYPNYALEDHWNDGSIQSLLGSKQFDFVVVQQGPSSQNDGRVMLLDYGARIKAECDKYSTKLAFFMVWPAYSNFNNFDGVIKNYTDAATATNSLLCPVGKIWKEYMTTTSDYSYYGPDMFHPSKKGSEKAAQVIYETLFK